MLRQMNVKVFSCLMIQQTYSTCVDSQHGCSYRLAISRLWSSCYIHPGQHQECVTSGACARLIFKYVKATSAPTSPVQILRTSAQQSSKRPANAQRQERQNRRREAWVSKRKAAKAAAVPAAPASQQAAVATLAEAAIALPSVATASAQASA